MQKKRPARSYGNPSASPFPILIVLLIALGVLLAGGLYLITAQTVTVVIGDQRRTMRTHQTTVRAALAEAGVYLEAEDSVTPTFDAPIRSGMIVMIDRAHPVVIDADGQQRRILTHKTDPRDILSESQIALGEHDTFIASDSTPTDHISVIRALSIQLADGGPPRILMTTARTVSAALAENKVALYAADAVTPNLSAPLVDQMTITIQRSAPVTIRVDGRTLVTRTHGSSIGAVLAEAGIALVGLDSSEPPIEQPFTPGVAIRVIRVTETDEIIRTEIPFKTTTQPDPALDLDTRQVIQPGVVGVQEIHVRVRREDGMEVSRSAPLSWIAQPPRDEIAGIGTRLALHPLETPDGTVQYWRLITMRAASYKPASTGKTADDPTYGLTASGQKLRKGIVAVDPALIPLGTALYIPKYGKAVAADTGGTVAGAVIDLGYGDDDYEEWSGTVQVYLLAPAPAANHIPPLPETPPETPTEEKKP